MQLVENLYAAFADVPKPTKLEGCALGCCMPKEDELRLLGQSLRQSDPEILWHYIDDAIWTVGDKYDFKYYTPRLLELGLTTYDLKGYEGNFIECPEVLGKKLDLADFDDWDAAKRDAVDDAVFAIMLEEARRENFYNFSGWMCAICNVNIDKARYINFLDSSEGHDAREGFLSFHDAVPKYDTLSGRIVTPKDGRMEGPFWDEITPEKTDIIYQWVLKRRQKTVLS